MKRAILGTLAAILGLGGFAAGQEEELVLPTSPHRAYNSIPFGVGGAGLTTVYHQVYSASLFGSEPVRISRIAFAPTDFAGVRFTSQDLGIVAINLGYTSRVPEATGSGGGLSIPSPGGGGAPNAAYVIEFYSAQPTTIAVGAGGSESFDQMEFEGTPFTYHPSQGNLLLEVVCTGSVNTRLSASNAGGLSNPLDGVSRAWRDAWLVGNVSQGADQSALRTRFTIGEREPLPPPYIKFDPPLYREDRLTNGVLGRNDGQDGWFNPSPADSADFRVLNLTTRDQDFSALGEGTRDARAFARAERPVAFTGGEWSATWECWGINRGPLPARDNLGSFSLQPRESKSFIGLMTWGSTPVGPEPNAADHTETGGAYHIALGVYTAAPWTNPTYLTPGPQWRDIPAGTPAKCSVSWNFDTGQVLRCMIRFAGVQPTVVDVSGKGWYLYGGPGSAAPLPEGIRLFTGGGTGTNFTAWDNLDVGPAGSCCLPSNGGCREWITEKACQAAGGTFRGQHTYCDGEPCRLSGACCLPSGTCILTDHHSCASLGGTFRGVGTDCNNPCPPKATLTDIGPGQSVAVSGDGKTVIGGNFRWTRNSQTPQGVLEYLGGAGSARAVNHDGSVIVGWVDGEEGPRAAAWRDGAWSFLGDPHSNSAALDVSGDGSTAVGQGYAPYGACCFWNRTNPNLPWVLERCYLVTREQFDLVAPRYVGSDYARVAYQGDGTICQTACGVDWRNRISWVPQRGFVWGNGTYELPYPGDHEVYTSIYGFRVDSASSGAGIISASGRYVLAGVRGSNTADLWEIPGGIIRSFFTGPGGVVLTAISDNGSVIVGFSNTSPTQAVRMLRSDNWTPRYLGNATVYSVSGDGEVMGGSAGAAGAVLRSGTSEGWLNLHDYLEQLGVDVAGWRFTAVTSISFDGAVVTGSGTYQGAPRAWVATLPVPYPPADTDGDGLLDRWETEGIPYFDGVETRYLRLPGAHPRYKDLFIEVDEMETATLSQEAVNMVVASFAAAPVKNPDTLDETPQPAGIRLHVIRDEPDLPARNEWELGESELTNEFESFRRAYFGTDEEHGNAPLLEAKAKAYRYCIVADKSGPERIGGVAHLGGDNFVVFVGSLDSIAGEAAAFMHELGHCLGLGHGGCDGIQGKPNYPSIMNYVNAYRTEWNDAFWRLDYSRAGPEEGLLNLFEGYLDETAGIGPDVAGYYTHYKMPFGVWKAEDEVLTRGFALATLKGGPVDFGDPVGNGTQDNLYGTVVQDLNFIGGINIADVAEPSGGQVLQSFNDWANIHLGLRSTRAVPQALVIPDEPSVEVFEWMDEHFPVAAVCRADFNGDDVLDQWDILEFQMAFRDGSIRADFDGNFEVDALDVVAFHQAWAAGCP